MTKKLLLILPFLLCLSAPVWAGLGQLVDARSQNYLYLQKHYTSLSTSLNEDNRKHFCSLVESARPNLVEILQDDNLLIFALRSTANLDFYNYSIHLEENSFSPLFANNAFRDMCLNNSDGKPSELIQSIKYHLMNVHFLKTTHELWINAFGPFED
jgi:hypothetical protein